MKHILFILLFLCSVIANTTMAAFMSSKQWAEKPVVAEQSGVSHCHSMKKHQSATTQDSDKLSYHASASTTSSCDHCEIEQSCFCSAHLVSLPGNVLKLYSLASPSVYSQAPWVAYRDNQPDSLFKPPRFTFS